MTHRRAVQHDDAEHGHCDHRCQKSRQEEAAEVDSQAAEDTNKKELLDPVNERPSATNGSLWGGNGGSAGVLAHMKSTSNM